MIVIACHNSWILAWTRGVGRGEPRLLLCFTFFAVCRFVGHLATCNCSRNFVNAQVYYRAWPFERQGSCCRTCPRKRCFRILHRSVLCLLAQPELAHWDQVETSKELPELSCWNCDRANDATQPNFCATFGETRLPALLSDPYPSISCVICSTASLIARMAQATSGKGNPHA